MIFEFSARLSLGLLTESSPKSVLLKQPCVEQCGNYIVEGMSAGSNAKSAGSENNGKENSRDSSKSKTSHREDFRPGKLSVKKHKMMMKAEKDRRYNYRYGHSFKSAYAENRFKKQY